MKGDEIIEFEEGWNIIEKGIQKLKNVLEGLPEPRFTSYDFMMTYSTIYAMCTQKHPHDYSSQLYEKYKESIQDYILSSVLPSLREKQEEFALREVVNRLENHKLMVRLLSHFFRYLDRFYIYRARVSSLETLGFMLFRDLVYQEAIAKVRDAVASLIDREREGEQIDVNAEVKKAFVALTEMRMATIRDWYGDFEAAILERTSVYYSQKASNWIALYSFSDYVLKAEKCLKRERERVAPYLRSCSKPKLLEKVQQEIYPKQLLDRELSKCHAFVGNDKIDYLSETFTLFSKVPQGLEHIASIFKEHVTTKGMVLVKQTEDSASNNKANNVISLQQQVIIKEVIELHEKYLQYVKDNFSNHGLFLKALMCAFEVFCDKGIAGSSIAELLVTFCDNILKKGGTKLSDAMIEETLEKVVKLISCISDKDLWAELYRKKLANRLLFYKSANYDRERSFLTKLKLQFGGLFTSKMEGMVRDMMLAKEDQTKFGEYLSNSPNADFGIDFTVTVLTTGFWPSYKSFNLNLPREMMRIVESFEEFYLTKTKHRKLRWIHSLGSCNMSGNFETKTLELIVTPYQASALLLFNSSDRLSYSEIKTNLSLSDNDVTRLLHSLSCGKYKILNKEPNTEKISPTDYLEFNSKFTNPTRMVKIPLPSLGNDKKKVIEEVDKDRRYALDATIVRIMKSRRVLGHQQLLTECVEQLSTMFKPNAKAIKQRIENLIFREYLERDTDDLNLLRFLE